MAALVAYEHADHVYDEIRRAIVEGRHPPGGRLIERQLAEDLDVSRTPVREALRRLEAEGLIVLERNRGAHVRRLSDAEIADLYDARSRLESYAAELAADRAEPADLERLDAAATAFDEAVGDVRSGAVGVAAVRRLDTANGTFHSCLLDASRHTRLRQLVGRTVDVPLVFQAFRHFGVAELDRSSIFHHLIRDAVAGREPARAGRLMAEHVLQGRDALLEHLTAGGITELFRAR